MNKIILPFMTAHGEQKHITENYVSVPPALTITDEAGSVWTLGFKFGKAPKGEYAFNVLRDGVDTGEIASRIERRKNEIWIFTASGFKQMPVSKKQLTRVYAFGARAKTQSINPISVKIYFDTIPEVPVVSFVFDWATGGLHDLRMNPIVCTSNQWFYAVTSIDEVEVSGYLGNRYIRHIPNLGGELK